MTSLRKVLLGGAALALAMHPLSALADTATPDMAEMWRVIQAQQAEIDRLRGELVGTRAQAVETRETLETTVQHVEAVADAVETSSASGGDGWWNKTSLGGYGELHYEGGAKDQIDFHRFVLFVGHEFTDNIRFHSEIELEHAIAGNGKVGEFELEQAYLEMDVGKNAQVFGGVSLIPVGIINETHEPPTFYGVERNAVEKNIIPATWWEGGIGARGNIGNTGFSWDAMFSSGLNLNANNGYKIRSGRNKVGKAEFNSQAYSARLGYSGILGISLAASIYYQPDVTQGVGDTITGGDVSATLFTVSADTRFNGFGLRALYSHWNLDGADVNLTGRDKQSGFYLEPSYKFSLPMGDLLPDAQFGVFYRYSDWDNNAGLNNQSGQHRNVFGANFWPIEDIVFKIDYISESKESGGPTKNSVNLGLGYQF